MDKNSKAIIYFLFLLISFSLNAQSHYIFDYKFLIKSNLSTIDKSQFLINSENPNYVMYQYHDKAAKIFDHENNEVIVLNHNTEFNRNIYKFISSQKFNPQNRFIADDIIIEEKGDHQYLIEWYQAIENRKTKIKLTVKLKPWDKDLIRFYFSDLDDGLNKRLVESLKEKLNGNYNFIIESYTINYGKGYRFSHSIENLEEIRLKIVL
ncbi:hypothetical protein [Chryseobacterium aureum]|uniref:hypothetical protein n=1 Tax=Chryseobacterium aureum TaxID=2497456 RepID=UPI000F87810A|nr:hypothetical protein [Chryseobacterium aureum]